MNKNLVKGLLNTLWNQEYKEFMIFLGSKNTINTETFERSNKDRVCTKCVCDKVCELRSNLDELFKKYDLYFHFGDFSSRFDFSNSFAIYCSYYTPIEEASD